MEQYFEYRLWTDLYIPTAFAIAFVIVCLFIGICKFLQWLKDKIKNNKK